MGKISELQENVEVLSRKPGGGGHGETRSGAFLADLADQIQEDPTISMSKVAKAAETSKTSVSCTMQDLGLVSVCSCLRIRGPRGL